MYVVYIFFTDQIEEVKMSLTEGALAKIMRGEDIGDFTVQVNYCDVVYIVSAHYENCDKISF